MLYGEKKHYNVMIVIPNKNFTADSIRLVQLLNSTTKVNMQELQIVDEFVKGDANTYVVRKMRKTQYKLQKLFLVATYEDKENQEWHMLMPSELTKALSTSLNFYLDMANKGIKAPSAKQLRMMSALGQFLGGNKL